jgi:isoprenylcysteine carboxyl methyltransferase (ICMT) family protein YpbQ
MTLLAIGLLIFAPMLVEAARARRNERAQKARGGLEPPDDVYTIMRIVYPAAFVAMLAEGAVRGRGAAAIVVAGSRSSRRQRLSSGPRFSRSDDSGRSV